MSSPLTSRLDRVAARTASRPQAAAVRVAIEQPRTGFAWRYGPVDQPYFVASITKLYVGALIMQLRGEGVLDLDTPVAEVLGTEVMQGLCVYRGRDYGPEVTVGELLSNSSGIPDFFEQRRLDRTRYFDDIMANRDVASSFADLIGMARQLPARFAPSSPGRAQYSDTNWELLGRIVEVCTGGGLSAVLNDRILAPQGLSETWMLTPENRSRYNGVGQLYAGWQALHLPQMISSWPASGAVVSTAADQLKFAQLFFSGALFDGHYLAGMMAPRHVVLGSLTPIRYGYGLMRFAIPKWTTPGRPIPEMYGHSGASGSVLYYVPEFDLYVAATVNQFRDRALPHQLLARLVAQFR